MLDKFNIYLLGRNDPVQSRRLLEGGASEIRLELYLSLRPFPGYSELAAVRGRGNGAHVTTVRTLGLSIRSSYLRGST